jgi:peroxiredoxin
LLILVVGLALGTVAGAQADDPSGQPWIGLVLTDGGFGGTRVKEVMDGSPGQRAGIVAGDEVLSIDDHKTESMRALVAEVKRAGLGHLAHLRLVDKRGHTRTVSLKLEARPDMETLQRNTLVGRPAPDFALSVQAGSKLGKLSSLRGQVVLLDFFATWCGPCVQAMPHLEELHERLGSRGLKVIGISTESPSTVAAAAERFHLKYPLASDEGEAMQNAYHVFALPTLVLIDRQGVVREVSVADPGAIEAELAEALRAAPRGTSTPSAQGGSGKAP